jgi:hypothetical protein
MNIGDLVRVDPNVDRRTKSKFIFQHILNNNLIGIVTERKLLYYSKYEGEVFELTVQWNDGTFSDLSEKYLEVISGKNND